jgi:hypothetical protein
MHNDEWSEKDLEILLEMAKAGNSQSQIGAVLKRSRNAVAGKLSRMGISIRKVENPRHVSNFSKSKRGDLTRQKRNIGAPPKVKKSKMKAVGADLGFRVPVSEMSISTVTPKGANNSFRIFTDFDDFILKDGPEPIKFMDLGKNQCRFIFGPALGKTGPDSLCCGADTDGGSYCKRHRFVSKQGFRDYLKVSET